MTQERAEALRPGTLEAIRHLLAQGQSYQELFICLGREYYHALDGWQSWRPPALIVHTANGSIGMRQAQLRDWLYGAPPPPAPIRQQGAARIRGKEVNLLPEQVLEVARAALRVDSKGAASYRMWYVQVDNQRVSPKWLVSKVTGLPLGDFHTDWARQFLNRLEISVHRNTNTLSEEAS
jgi:hypothetical protein